MKKSLRAKAFVLILAFAVLLSSLSIFVSYLVYKNSTEVDYKNATVYMAQTVAVTLDGDRLEAIAQRAAEIYQAYCDEHGVPSDMDSMSDEEREAYLSLYSEIQKMPAYQEMAAQLDALWQANNVLFLYVTLWDTDNGLSIFLLDAQVNGEANPVGYVEAIDPSNLESVRAGSENIPAFISEYEDYGWLCSASCPILASDGHTVAHAYSDVSMESVKDRGYKFLSNYAIVMLLVTLALIPALLALFDRCMVRPIRRISEATNYYINGGQEKQNIYDAVYLNRQDEIGQLYNSLQTMEGMLEDYIRHITEITAEKERVSTELHVATQIQADMLPSIFPAFPTRHEFDIYATMAPAKEVGGDFYDFFLIDDDHLAMVMADVSGKGVPAALFMVIAKTLIKNRAQSGGSPAEILADVNNTLCEGNKAQLFVTVWLGILTISTGKGVAANAGHEDPVIRRGKGDFEIIKYKHSPAVAALESIRFREHEFELFPGDGLFVYTDGVPEATNAQEELYGTDRMLAALNRHKDEPLDAILRGLRDDINRFVGPVQQFDDITMLGFTYYGPEGSQSTESQAKSV